MPSRTSDMFHLNASSKPPPKHYLQTSYYLQISSKIRLAWLNQLKEPKPKTQNPSKCTTLVLSHNSSCPSIILYKDLLLGAHLCAATPQRWRPWLSPLCTSGLLPNREASVQSMDWVWWRQTASTTQSHRKLWPWCDISSNSWILLESWTPTNYSLHPDVLTQWIDQCWEMKLLLLFFSCTGLLSITVCLTSSSCMKASVTQTRKTGLLTQLHASNKGIWKGVLLCPSLCGYACLFSYILS